MCCYICCEIKNIINKNVINNYKYVIHMNCCMIFILSEYFYKFINFFNYYFWWRSGRNFNQKNSSKLCFGVRIQNSESRREIKYLQKKFWLLTTVFCIPETSQLCCGVVDYIHICNNIETYIQYCNIDNLDLTYNNKLLCVGMVIAVLLSGQKNEYLKKQKGAMDRRRSEE